MSDAAAKVKLQNPCTERSLTKDKAEKIIIRMVILDIFDEEHVLSSDGFIFGSFVLYLLVNSHILLFVERIP